MRGADQSIAPRSADTRRDLRLGQAALPRRVAHPRLVPPPEHRARDALLRGQRHAYMVMEFVEGAALGDWIKPRRPLAEAQVAALVGPLLDGLEVVHKSGFLHRDIKPGNIYVRDDGTPGAARLRLGAPALGRAHRDRDAGLRAVRAVPHAGQPGAVERPLRARRRALLDGHRQPAAEAAARVREDKMPSALQAGDRSRFRPEFLAAIDWALAPYEDQRPQSVAEWREALLGGSPAKLPAVGAQDRRSPPQESAPSGLRSGAAQEPGSGAGPARSARSRRWW